MRWAVWSASVMMAVAQDRMATVNHPLANMFSRASDDADVVSQAIFGTNVAVLEGDAKWSRIQTPDGYAGWVESALLVPSDGAYGSAKGVEVTSLFAHIYREKSVTRHQPLLTLPFESKLELGPASDERWLGVALPDRRSAWVQRGDVLSDVQKLDVTGMIALSRRFLGLPYTWGGTSPFGYDCSGFTQMLQRRRGVTMPRDAHEQDVWDGVVPVEKDALEPGDLLFFGPDGKKITHTGMYIGGGEFIHATAHEKPMVQISTLSDPHWTKLFISARRPK
jgi:gamma-D-glutamyl-L-lysine dipeptidyl-peptidase